MKKTKKKITPFSKLSKPQQRVRIAKDVLLQLKKKKYIAAEGAYINNTDLMFYSGLSSSDDIQKNFSKIHECRCCALGSCLLSITKFKNTLNVGDVMGKYNFLQKSKKLFKMFSPKQLLLIENSFEGRPSSDTMTRVGNKVFGANTTRKENIECMAFYYKYPNSNSRLIAIMKNIVANKGSLHFKIKTIKKTLYHEKTI